MSQLLPPSEMRVSDAERALVESRLRRAVEAGQLELIEFDQRAQLTWAARTRGELEAVTQDLGALPDPGQPAPMAHTEPPERTGSVLDRMFSDTGGGTAMKVLVLIWACAFVANVVTWVAVCVGTGDLVHPWPMYQLPSGAILATLYGLGVGRPH